MRDSDATAVRQLPLFRDVDQANFETLIAAGYLQKLPAGVVLLHEGESADFLHVLMQGKIDLYSMDQERETTLSVLSPPAAFILAAVVVDGVYLKSARTLAPSTVVLIPADAVRRAFACDQAFARATVIELANRYRALVKDLKNQRLRTAVERLGNWLLAEDARTGATGSFRLPFEKRVLANQLGMRPENLSRCLADLARLGVDIDGASITIRDRTALARVCRPNRLIDDPST